MINILRIITLSISFFIISFLCIWLYFNKRNILKRILIFKSEKRQYYVYRIEYVPKRKKYFLGLRFLECGVIPEQYNVYYINGYKEYSFNNKKLYEKAKAGMRNINIVIHKGYNKKGKLKYVYYTLE